MRVKKLEIFGFKSFAHKTVIHFEPGVTAIVGPNGSGKCVHGDSRVVLADGRVVPIKELVEEALRDAGRIEDWDDGQATHDNPYGLRVLSLNPASLKVEPRPITAFIKRTAPAILYRIVTRTGRELVATGYHPLFTLDGGALKSLPADQLRLGMRIAIPRTLPVSGASDALDRAAIFSRFSRGDSVYVPHSPALEQWVNHISERGGGLAAVARRAGIERGHVSMVRQGQAVNAATVSRLQTWSQDGGDASVGTVLQASRGAKAAMTIPSRMTPALARFLGYCISEGQNTSANQVWFVNSDPALVEDFCRCAAETFGVRPRVLSYKPNAKDVLVFSHALCLYLEKAFGFAVGQLSAEKQAPDVVLGASEECVRAFLSALFEGDGHVAMKMRAGRTIAYVEYATASHRLADDVCLLLLRFGIVGRIATKRKAATNTRHRVVRTYYSVMIYGVEQLTRLAEVLEFRGEKRRALECLRLLNQSPNPNDDVVPGVTPLVNALVRQAGLSVKRLRKEHPTLAAYYEGRCEATRPGIRRVLDAVQRLGRGGPEVSTLCERLRLLAESDVYWDAIASIEPVRGTEWVYDLTVDGYHNFIANGMVVHNSNIVDSIRWVLGEHNPRDVRAPRLEDVIFNGTDKKAPLSMAEVHLTIANEQGLLPIAFTEVTITRRVYRSGESECFINQSPCRLKDIQELFLGTGLGGGTYAIIEQGHIDLILSSKPEERRIVFEEASGVAKYLAKKRETMRRLDEVEEHLVRIADIIAEVRRQVAALERAANKARQYKTQWEQLKQLELRLVVDELGSGQTRDQELETRVRALQAKRDELEAQKQTHVTSLEAANAAVSAIAGRLQELRTQAVTSASEVQQHDGQLALKTRWIEELAQQVQQAEAEAVQLRERTTQLDEQLARVGGAEAEVAAQLSAVEEQAHQGGGELAALEVVLQSALETLETAKAQLFDAASEASHQRNRLAGAASRLQGVEAHVSRLEAQRTQRTAHADELRRRSQAAFDEHAALQRACDELRRRLTTAQELHDAASARRHELTGRLHELRDRLAGERARAALLEDLWHRYEGFPDTVKTLMSRQVDGLIGPLVDLVQPAPGYEEVVEAALGPLGEALVVRDRRALSRCRELLNEQGLEGCRFLVLSDCPLALAMEPAGSQEGVAGAVKQYVRAEPEYQPLVDWLLNDSWVIDDIQRLLGQARPPQGRLVSQRGERWDRRSWRFGRTTRASASSRFGRKQRWEAGQAVLQALEEEFRRVEADSREAEQAWQARLSEQEAAKGQAAHTAPALHKLDAQAMQLARELERLDEEQRACELEAGDLTAQREELCRESAQTERAVQEAQERQRILERALGDAQAARESSEQRRQQLLITRTQVESSRQSLTERRDALRARRAELDADKAGLLQQLESRVARRQDVLRRSEELSGQLEEHRQAVQRLTEERSRLDAEAEAVSQTLNTEEATRDQLLPHLLAAEQELSTLMRQLQEQAQQLSERTYRRTHLVERLRELYQIDQTAIDAERQANPPPLTDEQRAQASEQVQKLRAKLEGIGPVSLGSVEEYDELKRRLDFLQTQQQDLVQARDDLKTSITQINRTARTQFRETFERIKQEFQHYYTRLFDGGEANLILLDEEDVLESGIDIVARPPGKRLQSISLLSGGERAITAVALLFALFKVRPSPFCILDEIDAPLDEANVDRFTRVLEEFLTLSQFILVTHNKKTITKADSLYGVTMEEPGISKILSAKLTPSRPPSSTVPVAA